MTPRVWFPFAILLAFAGCQDTTARLTGPKLAGPQFQSLVAASSAMHIVQQSPTAPPLQAYQVSFWAYEGTASTVRVNYQAGASQSGGPPFLRFEIPQLGLLTGAGGAPLAWGDSVLITLTIDPVSFDVDFQPSGVQFNPSFPATLTLWYGNASQDGDSQGQTQQLAVWWHDPTTSLWFQQPSTNDTTQPSVTSALYHFSEYAASW
jgi:hypothetical protein